MAKVMISLPDDLLAEVDAAARARGKSRSGLLREAVQREIALDAGGLERAVARSRARARRLGGLRAEGSQLIREQRDALTDRDQDRLRRLGDAQVDLRGRA